MSVSPILKISSHILQYPLRILRKALIVMQFSMSAVPALKNDR